jgi:hypothetical protein
LIDPAEIGQSVYMPFVEKAAVTKKGKAFGDRRRRLSMGKSWCRMEKVEDRRGQV